MQVASHTVRGMPLPRGRLLAAVRPQEEGADWTLYFNAQTRRRDIFSEHGFEVTRIDRIGGGLRVMGRAAPRDGCLPLPMRDAPATPHTHAPQTALFAGLRCAIALDVGQTPAQLCDWLRFHARHHRLQAVLVVDRKPPDAPSAFPEALAGLRIEGLERVVLLRLDSPLGQPETAPAAHPLHAPDAPGKHRLQAPAPDAWTAPFAQTVLFEMLRHLYLGEARAVLNLELSDLLPPLDGCGVFELAAKAPNGVVPLRGKRVFPWRRAKDRAAEFSDHICTRFDGGTGNPRWCLDLSRAPAETTWRMLRISGADADEENPQWYLRCMAIRHPGVPIARIVPKSALIEDPKISALMIENFGRAAACPPKLRLAQSAASTTHRSGIVTCMKNEGPFILEWLAYHRAIGVEEFLVYSNDCTDGTDRLLELLDRKGFLHHRENPYKTMQMKPQHAALRAAGREELVQGLDWVIVTDVDEFINIHVGDGTLSDLYAAVGDANMISMTWRLFGNADVDGFDDRFVTEQFLRCAPLDVRKPHHAWGFKTAARNTGIFKKFGVHRPKGLRPQLVHELRWVNGSGKPMPARDYRTAWRSTKDTWGYDLVTLNHYALRSAQSFLVKRDRGRVNHVDRDQGLNYWFRMNHNAEEDRSILRMLPAARAEMARLLTDPEIAAAHGACVTAHRARIAALLGTEEYRALHAEITGERMRKLSRMLGQFGSAVFENGPGVIPDIVLSHAGDPDFFFTVAEAPNEK